MFRPSLTQFLFLVAAIGILATCTYSAAAYAQGPAAYSFKSIAITVDIASTTNAHVTRVVSIFVEAGNLTYLDWGLWYQGRSVTITKAWDNAGSLRFIYPGPASQPDMPALRVLFPKSLVEGQTYNFSYAYDVTGPQDLAAWTETLDTSTVSISALSIIIELPTSYYFTGIQPASAITGETQDGRTFASWVGTDLYGQSSVGLSVGFSREQGFFQSQTVSFELLRYALPAAAAVSLSIYSIRSWRSRGKPQRNKKEAAKAGFDAKAKEAALRAPRSVVTTGIPLLDYLLQGGLPKGSTTILSSAACNERDIILRKFLEAGLRNQEQSVYLGRDASRIEDLLVTYKTNLNAIVENPAEGTRKLSNVHVTAKLENLTSVNIDLMSLLHSLQTGVGSKRLCIDILDDMLFIHKMTLTRKWLSEMLLRAKNLGLTVMATLNPEMHPIGDVEGMVELFDGHIQIIEKEVEERPRRILRIRKMFQWEFLDIEAVLDRNKLV